MRRLITTHSTIEWSDPSFWLSALLIQLWHLQWYLPPSDFRAKHLATRDELSDRLIS